MLMINMKARLAFHQQKADCLPRSESVTDDRDIHGHVRDLHKGDRLMKNVRVSDLFFFSLLVSCSRESESGEDEGIFLYANSCTDGSQGP